MGKVTVDSEKCKECMLCADVCDQGLLKKSANFNAAGYYPVEPVDSDECNGCGLCATMCPEAALEVTVERKGKTRTVASRPEILYDVPTTYCPGCSHGVVHRVIGEVLDDFGVQEKVIGVTPIGCSIFIYKMFNVDYCEGAHGRAPAVATGMKRVQPDSVVFTYQGDGDIGAIGIAEIIHAASRNENFTVIFVNNGNYGMTGGQMAPTTLLDQVTTSTPYGRKSSEGYPMKMCEMLATLEGNLYLARGAADTPKNIRKTKRYIKQAFQNQIDNKGFSMVEILGTCPANWRKSPQDSIKFVQDVMIPYFPLGELRTIGGDSND